MRALYLSFVLALFGCGADTPVPDYPFPDAPPLEETDLAEYVDTQGGEEEVEEDWDDGLSDEDLEMSDDEAEEETASEG